MSREGESVPGVGREGETEGGEVGRSGRGGALAQEAG